MIARRSVRKNRRVFGASLPATIALSLAASMAQGGAAERVCDQLALVYTRCQQPIRAAGQPLLGQASASAPVRFDGAKFHFSSSAGEIETPCSDGIARNFYDRIQHMDVASILQDDYVTGPVAWPPGSTAGSTAVSSAASIAQQDEAERKLDAGRLRNLDLLKAVYGESAAEVSSRLVAVRFLEQTVAFNRANGAAAALGEVGRAIELEARDDFAFAQKLSAWRLGSGHARISQGTFNWRVVAGTNELSAHSFGIAIDLEPTELGLPQYWRWTGDLARAPEAAIGFDFRLPPKIALFPEKLSDIFERHGFIWGAKWRHFDAMHFEFRPEFFKDYRQSCPR